MAGRSSLRIKWTAAMLFVALAPLAIVAVVVVRQQRQALADVEGDLELALADQSSHEVAAALDDGERAMHRAATILASPRVVDEDLRLDLAREAIATCDLIEWVSVFDKEGGFIGSIVKGSIEGATTLPLKLAAGERPRWIHDARIGSRFFEPLLADGAVTGALLGGARPGRLDGIVEELGVARFGRKDLLTVVDDELRVVAGAEPPWTHGQSLAHSGVFRALGLTPEAFSRPLVLRGSWNAAGEEMIGTVRTLPAQRWAVVVQRPESDAFRTLAASRRAFAVSAALLALLAVAVGSVVARRTTRPIGDLVALTGRYAKRQFDAKSGVTSNDELGTLATSLEDMAQELAESERSLVRHAAIEAGLARYLPAGVAAKVAAEDGALSLGGRRAEVSVLFADVAAFTPFVERASPEDVVLLLNELFTVLSAVVFRHNGIVDKFMGDSIMAIFGARADEDGDHVTRALSAAEDMQRFASASAARWRERFAVDVELGIGVGTGEALVGNLGSDLRVEFTAVGDSVNVAARLENLARPGQTLVTAEVAAKAGAPFEMRSLGQHPIRGKKEPMEIFELVP
ncbi:MAG: HAMP domain-containing protein [Labilithrix sp.]|nr:HAMP domain-containing protein [Labilithrix sp.]MCW5811836.1 HAMP domain-containing protein [Labilithrix sp.]